MSIEQKRVIDFVGLEPASGKVILTIADHLPWDDEGEHLLALQDKIDAYIAFVESGELAESYPSGANRVPVIRIAAKFPIPVAGHVFLERVRPILESAGIELRYGVLKIDRPS